MRERKRTELVGREGERRGGGGQEVMSYTVIFMPHTRVHIHVHVHCILLCEACGNKNSTISLRSAVGP